MRKFDWLGVICIFGSLTAVIAGALILQALHAQTRVNSTQLRITKPLPPIPGPLVVTNPDPAAGGWEFSPVTAPKPPDAPKLLLFLDATTGHLSVMDSAGAVRDLTP